MIYFTDRWHRLTGTESIENFVNNWSQGDDSFKSDAPNAALELIGAAENEKVTVVELSDLVFDPEVKTFQYNTTILEETNSESLSNFDKGRDSFIPEPLVRQACSLTAEFPNTYCNDICPNGKPFPG